MLTDAICLYEFGPFILNVEERLLLRDGEIIPLTPKAVEILIILVQNSGHVVERAKLMNSIWPETFVEEANITQHIFTLRRALGETHRGQEFIQTIARRGYLFTQTVKEVSAESGNQIEEKDRESSIFNEEEAVNSRKDSLISLAVLPFNSMSSDPEMEYLADGITENLINNLSQLLPLKISAPSAVFRYKGIVVNPKQVGRELSVHALLMGRVLRVGERLIVKTELVDVATGWQLWGEKYERMESCLIEMQEGIAKDITRKLKIKLTVAEQRLLVKRYTQDCGAYHLYLKGCFFRNKYTKEGIEKGLEYFQQAIELDPEYALAYAGLGESYYSLSNAYSPPKEMMPKARAAAARAIEIDTTIDEAYVTLGLVKQLYDWDWAGAETAFNHAIQLNPHSAKPHKHYGLLLNVVGRFDESMAELKLAEGLDPLSPSILVSIGSTFYLMRQYDQAIEQFKAALEIDPISRLAHTSLGMAYTQLGNFSEAIREFQEVYLLDKSPTWLGFLGYVYGIMGEKAKAKDVLYTLKDQSELFYVSPYRIALIYSALGQNDIAFKWLYKACKTRSEELTWLKVNPQLDTLRTDPRFTYLLRQVGLETR